MQRVATSTILAVLTLASGVAASSGTETGSTGGSLRSESEVAPHRDVADASMPLPFTRQISVQTPRMTGRDVFLLRGLLARASDSAPTAASRCAAVTGCAYDEATSAAVEAVQRTHQLPVTGVVDAATAHTVLSAFAADGYQWNRTAPSVLGYRYQIHCPVHLNRSIEATCTLHGGNGTVLFSFIARLHGASRLPAPAWPHWNSTGTGINEFTTDGCTPTGLSELDLNLPEDEPKEYGPYPVNRATFGLEGNAALLLTNTDDTPRGGILVHTGEWTCCGWSGPPAPMPNSLGCIHAYPHSIETVWKILTTELGVVAHKNVGGVTPYPYTSQGLLSVELVA
jgi:hypothetical protein